MMINPAKKKQEDRYASIADLIRDLEPVQAG
jgi:hypothetical protein